MRILPSVCMYLYGYCFTFMWTLTCEIVYVGWDVCINDDEACITIRVTFVLGIEPSRKHVFCAMRQNSNLNVLLAEFDHIPFPP